MSESLSSTYRPNRDTHSWPEWFVRVLALAIAYYVSAQIGLLLPSVGPMICILWPPAGIALAVLHRGGLRLWPGVLLGAFATNFGLCGPLAAAGIALGVTLAAIGAAWLLELCEFDREFRTPRDVAILGIAAAAGSLVAALAGTTSLALLGDLREAQASRAFVNWLLGDAWGAIVIAPLILSWSRIALLKMLRHRAWRSWAASFTIFLGVCFLNYGGFLPSGPWVFPLAFVPMLVIAWTASRFRAWSACLQVALLGCCCVWNNYNLSGPALHLDPTIRIYAAWAYLVTASVIALGLSGMLAERDTVERRLKTGEETYRALVHDNPALICRFSTDGHLLFANETFRRAFALPAIDEPSSLTRTNLSKKKTVHNYFQIAGLEQDARTLAELSEIESPEKPVCFETRLQPGPGLERWYRWTARAVDMSSSVVVEYHAVGLDVTSQKRAEAERKALEAQAIQTQQYEAIGVLAGGIAHEFNNILTSLIGNTDLATMMLPPTSEAHPMLAEVLRGAQRAAELTKQLSIYAGQTETHPRALDVSDLIRSCGRLLEVVIPKHCAIRYETGRTCLPAVVDETKVRQMVLSLVTNAAEAFPDRRRSGEITVRTTSRTVESESSCRKWVNGSAIVPGEYVQLEVSDTGCGMNPVTLGRIFEPFFTTKFPGRGLGMAAVLGIVQDHAGAIQVLSEVDRGTTVRVLLPTNSTSIDLPTPLPRANRRSARITNAMLTRK